MSYTAKKSEMVFYIIGLYIPTTSLTVSNNVFALELQIGFGKYLWNFAQYLWKKRLR